MSLHQWFGKAARVANGLTGGQALRAALNSLVKDYARVEEVKVDARQKTVLVRLRLHGEKEDISIQIGSYSLLEKPDSRTDIVLTELSSDKEWMQRLLANLVEGKPFPLPDKHRDVIVGFLS